MIGYGRFISTYCSTFHIVIAIGEDLLFFDPNESVTHETSTQHDDDDDSCLKIPQSISPTSYSPQGSYAGSSKTSESQKLYSKGRDSPAQSFTFQG